MIFGILANAGIDFTPVYVGMAVIFFLLFMKGFTSSKGKRNKKVKSGRRKLRSGRTTLPAPFRLTNVHVIDGDTLARGDWRIRIYGMDAPESDQPQGPASTAHMKHLVDGKTLHITPKDIDVYGRLVAIVRCGTLDIGKAMVDSGHAVATSDFTQVYSRQERRARRSRSGLWKKGAIEDPKAWRQGSS
jgi:endonuclease YncB( thermonuclease family)